MRRADIFQAIVADLAPAIEAKRQQVSIDVAQDACDLQADPAKLHDVVRNLLENAVNYSPEEAAIQLAASRHNRSVVITVSDSGPAFHRKTSRGCSNGFTEWTSPGRARAAPGSGSPS